MVEQFTRDGSISIVRQQLQDEAEASCSAPAKMDDVKEWMIKNKMRPTGDDLKDLAAANRMRDMLKIPRFSVVGLRPIAEPAGKPLGIDLKTTPAAVVVSKEEGIPSAISASRQLRDVLFREIEDLRSGASNPHRAASVAKLAHQIISSARLEMDLVKAQAPTIDGKAEQC